MANDRLPSPGLRGIAERIKHFLGTELGNGIHAAKLRKKYGLNAIRHFIPSDGIRFKMAVVAIFKGEDEYLKEWIEFHRIVGVEHFFLYDNGDQESSRAILKPYMDEGVVTYIPFADFPERSMRSKYGKDQFRKLSMQNLAYGDCARKYAKHCDWLAKIDLDEFLYPLEPYRTLPEAIERFAVGEVKGFSVMAARFGPSGRIDRSGLPVIETYDRRNPTFDLNWKVVGAGRYVSGLLGYHGCHHFFFKISPGAKYLTDAYTRDFVRINHYVIKSKAEYADKIASHSTGHKAGKETPEKWLAAEAAANVQSDGSILRFLPELKERLG